MEFVRQKANPPRKCPIIEIENGKARIKARGRVAKFKCHKKYTMFEGDKFATCVKGRWHGKIPKCIKTGCDYYDSIPNGEAVYLYNEALVQFICNPGYVLEGSSALTCDGFGWNDTIPECKAPTDVEYFCDFESGSICGWSNGEHDEFDWTRNRGPSASFAAGTGPKADHTLGTIFGHYMYIEASVPKVEGDRARLFSPVYPASFTESPTCFAFYYHMFGNTTGHLNIYMKGENDNMEFQAPVYQMGGYNHDNWILQVVHLHQLDSNFQVVLEGVRGYSYTSDIAIDDVKLAHGEDCDHLDEEALKQYQTRAPETTRTTTPTPETTLEAEISTHSSGGTEFTAIISSSTDMSNDILVMGGSSNGTTESPAGSVSSTVMETTSAAFQTSGGNKLESSRTPGPTLSTTLRSTTTAYSVFDPASDDDLSDIAEKGATFIIDPGTCGCDIECAHNHTCCLDVEEFCEGYLITMLPPSPKPVTTSASPSVTTAVYSTVEPTLAVTEPQSSTTKAPVMIITTVPTTPEITTTVSTTLEITTSVVTTPEITTKVSTTPEVTTTTEGSTALEPFLTETPTKSTTAQTQTPLVTTATSTKTTQQTTKSKPIIPKTPPTTTLEPTTETTTEPPTESTTVVAKTPSVTTTRATSAVVLSTKESSMAAVMEKTTSYAPYSPQPGTSGSSAAPSKGSNAATYAIVISTVIIFIIIAVAVIAYIRKRRRDKLPEDSDIQFLARDEIMMDGNIFTLSGTITQARNSAI
ncbi:uncharacterized protein [Macrobrachium rosenbergii]|uniref:uncharacterized protein isoform X2 n=1 Tax=Macrobrachium rosenbergii TaxID=79674 RepID=UPI0034D4EF69